MEQGQFLGKNHNWNGSGNFCGLKTKELVSFFLDVQILILHPKNIEMQIAK